jgi:hypothetical protein
LTTEVDFLLDHHVPPSLYAIDGSELGGGHPKRDDTDPSAIFDATHVREIDELGSEAEDEDILDYANREEMVVVTNDKDFLEVEIPENACVMFYPSQRIEGSELAYRIISVCKYFDPLDELYGERIILGSEWSQG